MSFSRLPVFIQPQNKAQTSSGASEKKVQVCTAVKKTIPGMWRQLTFVRSYHDSHLSTVQYSRSPSVACASISVLQDVTFPKFNEEYDIAIPLPGKLEPLPILDLVTKANSFPVSSFVFIMLYLASLDQMWLVGLGV